MICWVDRQLRTICILQIVKMIFDLAIHYVAKLYYHDI